MGELAERTRKALDTGGRLYPGHDELVRRIAELERENAQLRVPPVSLPTTFTIGDPFEGVDVASLTTAPPESRAEQIRRQLVQANGGGNWRQLANELAAREMGQSATDEPATYAPAASTFTTQRLMPGIDAILARLAAAEARAERAERDNAVLHTPETAGRRLVFAFSPSNNDALLPGLTASVNHDGVRVEWMHTGPRPRILSVAVFELDDVSADNLERRATELIEAGEKLLQEYEKRKAAADAASAEVLR